MAALETRIVTVHIERSDAEVDVDAVNAGLDEMLRDLGAEFHDRFPALTLTVER